jgi:hypothetical protein
VPDDEPLAGLPGAGVVVLVVGLPVVLAPAPVLVGIVPLPACIPPPVVTLPGVLADVVPLPLIGREVMGGVVVPLPLGIVEPP